MEFRDSKLDELASERRRLAEEQSSYKDEMSNTYREIQEVKDRLPPLYEKRNEARRNAAHWGRIATKEYKKYGPGNEDSEGSRRTSSWYADQFNAAETEIGQLRGRIDRLWDQHNHAKARSKEARDAYLEVDQQFQARLEYLRRSSGSTSRNGIRQHDSRNSQPVMNTELPERSRKSGRGSKPTLILLECGCRPPRRIKLPAWALDRGPIFCGVCDKDFMQP